MATQEEVQKWMQVVVDRINERGPDAVPYWGGVLQLVISDLDTGWLVKLAMDGTVESCVEQVDEKAATCVLEMPSDLFVGLYSGSIPVDEVRASGKLRVRKDKLALARLIPITV